MKNTNIQIYRYTVIQIYRYTDIHMYRYSDIQIYRYTDIQIYRYTDIQIYRYKYEYLSDWKITTRETSWPERDLTGPGLLYLEISESTRKKSERT